MAELHAVSTRLNEAREQERVKMARDIHDHLGQALTALKMDVAEVRRRLTSRDTALVEERLAEMSALIDSSVDDVRRVAAELRPVVLDDLGFVSAIRAYLIDVERRGKIRCMLNTTLSGLTIADDRATALFRILQEALTNVVRHAEARASISRWPPTTAPSGSSFTMTGAVSRPRRRATRERWAWSACATARCCSGATSRSPAVMGEGRP